MEIVAKVGARYADVGRIAEKAQLAAYPAKAKFTAVSLAGRLSLGFCSTASERRGFGPDGRPVWRGRHASGDRAAAYVGMVKYSRIVRAATNWSWFGAFARTILERFTSVDIWIVARLPCRTLRPICGCGGSYGAGAAP